MYYIENKITDALICSGIASIGKKKMNELNYTPDLRRKWYIIHTFLLKKFSK